jgi:SAM-dependent methyltransferase
VPPDTPPIASPPANPGPSSEIDAWDRYARTYQAEAQLPTSTAIYGPDIATEAELRLLGDLRGRRVLELGCGGAQASISFVKQGAAAIAVDHSAEQLAYARQLCEAEEVRVELRQGDLADLAFMRADSIDLVFSSYVFNYVDDLNRVFRQVHRVLKVGAPLVFSLPHPTWQVIDPESAGAAAVVRSAFDGNPTARAVQVGETASGAGDGGQVVLTEYPRTFAELYMGLARASYRVDLVLEPEPSANGPRSAAYRPAMSLVPRTLILRARKEGN